MEVVLDVSEVKVEPIIVVLDVNSVVVNVVVEVDDAPCAATRLKGPANARTRTMSSRSLP